MHRKTVEAGLTVESRCRSNHQWHQSDDDKQFCRTGVFCDRCTSRQVLKTKYHQHIMLLFTLQQGVVSILVFYKPTSQICASQLRVLKEGDSSKKWKQSRTVFYVVAGKPINERVERGGTFVMNTRANWNKALLIIRNGQFCLI